MMDKASSIAPLKIGTSSAVDLNKSTDVYTKYLPRESDESSKKSKRFTHRQSSCFNFVDGMRNNSILTDYQGPAAPFWFSHRSRLAVVCFCGFLLMYAQSFSLSITIVAMSGPKSEEHTPTPGKASTSSQKCGHAAEEERRLQPTFDWGRRTEAEVLGAFFWGYMLLQVPGGRLAEKIGAKLVIALGMFPVAVLSLLSPLAARQSPYLLLVVRVFLGMGLGVIFPAMQVLWSQWAPPNERGRLIGFSYAGLPFGIAMIFPVGGFLSQGPGWDYVFYLVGGLGLLWCCLWMLLVYDTPALDPGISQLEQNYITTSLENTFSRREKIPWLAFLKSRAVWAIIVGHTCANYGTYMFLTKIPGYMKEVLEFDIASNGTLSMIPYLCFWAIITLGAQLADMLISKGFISVCNTRKLMTALGCAGPACVLVGLGYLDCEHQAPAVVLLCLAVGMVGFQFSGFFVNHGDIAPPFAGTLFGITNMVATVPGIVAPLVVNSMTGASGGQEEWRHAFFVAVGIYALGAVFYGVMASGEIQAWAVADVDEENETLPLHHIIAEKLRQVDGDPGENPTDNDSKRSRFSNNQTSSIVPET